MHVRRVAQRQSRGQPAGLLDRDGRELPAFAPLPDGGARERSCARGLRRGDADGRAPSFTIANQDTVSQKQFPINPGNPNAIQHYSSAPELTPSTVSITTPAKAGASPGDLFQAPYQGKGTPGPMISEQNGGLVWFHPLPKGDDATNFQVQQYEGKPVLTWWQGRILEVGFGQGEDVIYNTSYQHVATIFAGNGYHADLHVVKITPQGTAWIDMFDPIHMNLSSAHGEANGVLTDSVVEEIDIKTGLVMWEWHALGHIPVSESNNPAPKASYPWDYVHINSISPGPEGSDSQTTGAGADQPGQVLLSSRNTWTLYDVDMRTGAIIWRLGGSHSSFKLGAGTRFYWQHDSEWQPGGLISVFDNGSDPPKEKQSRGLLLDPNTSNHTVTLVKQFTNPTKTLLAESQGNLLNLSPGENTSGNWLMGYGGLPNFTEYDPAGHVLLDGTLGKNVQSFRTYLQPWSAQAPGVPAVTVSGSTVAVSWNGATNVASWRMLGGASASALAPVSSAPKTGFQTTISVPAGATYVAVQALDASGAVLGTSRHDEGLKTHRSAVRALLAYREGLRSRRLSTRAPLAGLALVVGVAAVGTAAVVAFGAGVGALGARASGRRERSEQRHRGRSELRAGRRSTSPRRSPARA